MWTKELEMTHSYYAYNDTIETVCWVNLQHACCLLTSGHAEIIHLATGKVVDRVLKHWKWSQIINDPKIVHVDAVDSHLLTFYETNYMQVLITNI